MREPIPGLIFNPDTEEYHYCGLLVPRVTSILGVLGNGYRSQAVEAGMERGRAVHLATQYHDEGRLNRATLDQSLVPYFEAYLRFLADVKPQIVRIEQRIYHPMMQYAGTLDRIAAINGVEGVLDIKTGSVPLHTGPQTAAYYEAALLCPCVPGRKLEGRWSLVLYEDGTYKLNTYKDPGDWECFKAALVIHRWKERIR